MSVSRVRTPALVLPVLFCRVLPPGSTAVSAWRMQTRMDFAKRRWLCFNSLAGFAFLAQPTPQIVEIESDPRHANAHSHSGILSIRLIDELPSRISVLRRVIPLFSSPCASVPSIHVPILIMAWVRGMDEQHTGRTAFIRPNRPSPLENIGDSRPYQSWWDSPMAARPDMDSSAPHHVGMAFVPVRPLPSGLGIKDPAISAARYPGYQTVILRDPLQQNDESPLRSPLPAGASTTSTLTPEQQPFPSPYGVPYDYLSPYGASPPVPPARHGEPQVPAAWQRMLMAGWPMYAMFVLGLSCAFGHHAFYSSLDGKPANDQIRMVRFGGLLSYAAKGSFVGAVVYAYRQQIWVTVINKVLTLRTIDSLFEAAHEPKALLNWEFIRNARVAACLAMLVWLFPLTVILTPATLTVAPRTEVREDLCPGVRTLNFESEGLKNWRVLERINGYRVVSLSLYNSTVNNSLSLADVPFNSTFFDYFTGSSPPVDLVAAQSALTGAVIPRQDAALETCGGGWNCSYEITFTAPAYKCSVFATGPTFDKDRFRKAGAPSHFDPNNLIPNGNYSYLAETNAGNYAREQLDVAPGGAPLMKPPFPKNLGAFRTEPVLWIGYSKLTRPGKPPQKKDDPDWNKAFEAAVLRCEHYLAKYTVRFNHTASDQTTTVLRREFLHPVIDTTYDPMRVDVDDGTFDNTTATPKSNYVFPVPDYENYRVVSAYHSLGSRLRAYLQGVVQFFPFADPQTEASKTRIIDAETFLPATNLADTIQGLYENITLSLLSNPQFAVVAWAARPDRRSGMSPRPDDNNKAVAKYETASGIEIDNDYPYEYPCTRTRLANAYVFNRRDLWIAYAAALLVALLALVLGSAALSQNGLRARDSRVSNIVAAMRAPALDRFMLPGPDHDDAYRMVEDEFLAVAGDFTRHLHAAEYQRLKRQASDANADAIRSISRPVTGDMTDSVRRRHAALENAARQRRAVAKVLKGESDDDKDGAGSKRQPTLLQGLMDSPRKRAVPLMKVVGRRGGRDGSPTRGRPGRPDDDGRTSMGKERDGRSVGVRRELDSDDDDNDDLDGQPSWPKLDLKKSSTFTDQQSLTRRPPRRSQTDPMTTTRPSVRTESPQRLSDIPPHGHNDDIRMSDEDDDDLIAKIKARRAEQKRRRESARAQATKVKTEAEAVELNSIPFI
ncbi:hypothetical protein VTJ49DRAFT_3449 [Mycothermus thermophilus]|uniref:Uncharacterized protein n=1 Tax=Humicola insolens TaxID=85995 RepID=A0ABR3V7G5_HUMIN